MNALAFLSGLPARFPVEVHLTTTAGEQLNIYGTAAVTGSGMLKISDNAGDLAILGRIDYKSDCLVFIEAGEMVTLICSPRDNPSGEALEVRILELIRHGGSEKREFFRGPAGRISISVTRRNGETTETFRARGINVSCGGLLLMVSRPIIKMERLEIALRLPEPVNKSHTCPASVLRISQINENTYTTAVRFVELDSDVCDDIMAFCFAEERRRIKEYVLPHRT